MIIITTTVVPKLTRGSQNTYFSSQNLSCSGVPYEMNKTGWEEMVEKKKAEKNRN